MPVVWEKIRGKQPLHTPAHFCTPLHTFAHLCTHKATHSEFGTDLQLVGVQRSFQRGAVASWLLQGREKQPEIISRLSEVVGAAGLPQKGHV